MTPDPDGDALMLAWFAWTFGWTLACFALGFALGSLYATLERRRRRR